ncbi:hypothetical protein [Bathymodiolus japonicus methanotrophic gill symbiont]|uniref:hypothetical protein n=1 Tax=Bathymodiolus japonicus methanotrophic gill symbiont TaxID=113269 RepID=UPI001C8CFC58|nr:hypothetical protein [Bathymodiolus japonicus methanotrophic gill symbiont]
METLLPYSYCLWSLPFPIEQRIHTERAPHTPKLILDLKNQHKNRSYTQQRETGNEDKLIEDGAVK